MKKLTFIVVTFFTTFCVSCGDNKKDGTSTETGRISEELVNAYLDSMQHPLAVDPAEAIKKSNEYATWWLDLLKEKKYQESWNGASRTFRSFYPLEQWMAIMRVSYESLGVIEGRRLDTAFYTQRIEGYPIGKYVVINYRSKFSGSPDSITEHAVFLREHRKWRISAFDIR